VAVALGRAAGHRSPGDPGAQATLAPAAPKLLGPSVRLGSHTDSHRALIFLQEEQCKGLQDRHPNRRPRQAAAMRGGRGGARYGRGSMCNRHMASSFSEATMGHR
jgi:hypothetical protein